MDYLEKIADKKQKDAVRTETKQDVDSLIKELKEVQLAALLANSQKSPVILADSTDLGRVVADLGTKITNVLEAFKNDTTSADKLAQIAEDFKKLSLSVNKSADEQSKRVVSALNEVAGSIKALEMPQTPPLPAIPAPIVKVQERKIDFSPLQATIREAMAPVGVAQETGLDLDSYRAQDIDNSERDTQYIGFLNPQGDWYIIENRVKDNTLRYVFGRGNYREAFAKAGSYQYLILSEAVDAL